MAKKDLITIADMTKGEIENLFQKSKELKAEFAKGKVRKTLDGKSLAMIFEKPSTRTRVGFEVAMTQLGGHAIYLSPTETQIGRNEPLKDTARVLASYCDAILIRTFAHEKVVELAKWSSVPVINGLSDLLHPCQILSDIFTVKEHFGSLENLKMAYVGDGNNVANSIMIGCSKMGLPVSIACPEGHDPDAGVVATSKKNASATVEVVRDPAQAVQGANIIYTDVWASMGQESEAEKRKKIFASYQINSELLKKAAGNAIVMHCLPAHRGEEVTEEVAEGQRSIFFIQAANRLHVQKAILEWLIVS